MANISVSIIIYQLLLDYDSKLMPTENPRCIGLIKLLLGPWPERVESLNPISYIGGPLLKDLNPLRVDIWAEKGCIFITFVWLFVILEKIRQLNLLIPSFCARGTRRHSILSMKLGQEAWTAIYNF